MSSEVTFEPIQEPDGSDMIKEEEGRWTAKEFCSEQRAPQCVSYKERSESKGTGGRERE